MSAYMQTYLHAYNMHALINNRETNACLSTYIHTNTHAYTDTCLAIYKDTNYIYTYTSSYIHIKHTTCMHACTHM